MLVNEEVSFGHKGPEGCARMNVSSANQSRGPKGWFAVQGNILGNSIVTGKHNKNIG